MRNATEGPGGPPAYLLRCGEDGLAPAGGERAFPTLEEALAAVKEQAATILLDSGAPAGAQPLEIVCQPSGGKRRRSRMRRYRFYVNARAQGTGGDGSESAPWWGVATAAEQMIQLHRAGVIRLQEGHKIRLVHREVFTPTSLEKWKWAKELLAKCVFLAMTLALVLPMLAIFACLIAKAWPALSLSFLMENPKNNMTAGGIWAPLVGTFCLVFISLLIAAPVGVLAGVYLNEYARDNWLTRIVNLAVVNLAGVPSIVHALFGVGAFVLFAGMGRSVLAASCTLAVMTLPVIITSTREALASVPMAFREACWNLGASRWQTIRTIVLPNSISGILTGVILQVSRAAGETAPILFTGAMYFTSVPDHGWRSFFPYRLGDRCMALSYHLYTLSKEVRDVPESTLYGTAVVLIALVLAVNSLSIALRVYLRMRKRW
ncbi:MAG: phosphate ABC transporter permease PstA [Thermoguttaceae bacterium]